jgi:hypothetical protein
MRIARCLILTEPPSIDAGEITDKGYLNQRAVLASRAALVDRLHADPAPADVIVDTRQDGATRPTDARPLEPASRRGWPA